MMSRSCQHRKKIVAGRALPQRRLTVLTPGRHFRGGNEAGEPGIWKLQVEIPGSRWRAPRNDTKQLL
jgi:hypothetical protein